MSAITKLEPASQRRLLSDSDDENVPQQKDLVVRRKSGIAMSMSVDNNNDDISEKKRDDNQYSKSFIRKYVLKIKGWFKSIAPFLILVIYSGFGGLMFQFAERNLPILS